MDLTFNPAWIYVVYFKLKSNLNALVLKVLLSLNLNMSYYWYSVYFWKAGIHSSLLWLTLLSQSLITFATNWYIFPFTTWSNSFSSKLNTNAFTFSSSDWIKWTSFLIELLLQTLNSSSSWLLILRYYICVLFSIKLTIEKAGHL